jgi:hypothetical protein
VGDEGPLKSKLTRWPLGEKKKLPNNFARATAITISSKERAAFEQTSFRKRDQQFIGVVRSQPGK